MTSGSELDGRTARREKNRAAVLDAYGSLLADGITDPTFEQLAERAGVSYRSVYRYYDSLEDLKTDAFERVISWLLPKLEQSTGTTTSDDPLFERIDDLVASRLATYDDVHATVMLALFNVGSSPAFARSISAARRDLRTRIEKKFAPELDEHETASREMRLSVITQCLGFGAFNFYLEEFEHTHDDVRQLLWAQVYSALTGTAPDV